MELKTKIVNWIRKEIKKAKKKGIVLGLSGGIDSCVTAILAKEAMGNNLLVLILPCRSSKEDLEDAESIVKKFKLRTKIIDLTKIYEELLKILPKADRLTHGNLISRLRMLVLYYFANKLNYLVCGTTNKSEVSVGYYTKFGDGATDILPLGDLLKTQVRQLAKELGVPERIINKKPSAGFWPGQTDEDEMGITYPELDDILECIEKKRQILLREKVDKVKEMIKKSEHKRRGPKICYI